MSEMTDVQAKTFFTEEDSLFPALVHGDQIPIVEFLKASAHLGNFFSILGTVFTPVKSDILGNVQKLQDFINNCPENCQYVNDIVKIEGANPKSVAIDALLWLKRALEFTLNILDRMVSNETYGSVSEDLRPLCLEAYKTTLKRYHGWMVQQIFHFAMKACPWRKDVLSSLAFGKPNMEELVISQLTTALVNLRGNIEVINHLYSIHNLDLDTKV